MGIGRLATLVALIVVAAAVVVGGHSSRRLGPHPQALSLAPSRSLGLKAVPQADTRLQAQLKQLFPVATAFSAKAGDPPHFKAYLSDPAARTVGGYAFWTTELEPLERAYDGPIKMLVGMDTKGILTGIIVAEHHEPYGYFSVDLPAFATQFSSKNIRDPFRVGSDVDAISRATITVTSASRAVRNSARRIARAYLTPPEPPKP